MGGSSKTVLAIGGTGAQGVPVVKGAYIDSLWLVSLLILQELAADGRYKVIILTRSGQSDPAMELASLPKVAVMEGDAFDEPTLVKAFKGVDAAFVNTNGFAIGEKAEIYWGIRIYEIAYGAGVKHFVWGSLDYSSKLGNFDPSFHCGHLDGKGIVADFIHSQIGRASCRERV